VQINYKVGTVLIPIGDTETETIVFVGAMQGIMDNSSNGQERLEAGIEAIFKKWPD
jgi:hypothetical protein